MTDSEQLHATQIALQTAQQLLAQANARIIDLTVTVALRDEQIATLTPKPALAAVPDTAQAAGD